MAELVIEHTSVFTRNLESSKRIKLNQGGTRSSKTYSIAQLIVYLCMTSDKKHTYDICRKSLPSLKATAMKDFFEILHTHKLYNEANHNKTDKTYHLNGNEICFFSIDDQQKVRGRKRDVLWCNEANELDYEDFRQMIIRTTGDIFIDFNPDEPEDHWLFTEVASRDDCELIVSTYLDNPFLPMSLVSEIERYKLLDPAFWAVFGEGKRSDLQLGTVFLKKHYQEAEYLPADVKGVIYTDPNLSLKSKGDTTAITNLGYSALKDQYFIVNASCKSHSDSNELLDEVLSLKTVGTTGLAFDGNVTQESTWTNFVKNWARLHNSPFPRIEYKRYNVDDLAKNIQLAWNEGRVFFPQGFRDSLENKIYLSQLFAFTNKKAKRKDDAPDSLICAFEFLHERQIASRGRVQMFSQPVITESYNF
jgi:hypothetical protein